MKLDRIIMSYDGQTTSLQRELPDAISLYKCYSIYHDHADIWIVNYDATENQVHRPAEERDSDNENDDDDDSSEEEDELDPGTADWTNLTFQHLSGGRSYAGQNLQNQRLAGRRDDQVWADQLLPDTYRATRRFHDPDEGGLIGELPLLIGLLAYTIPSNYVAASLPPCIGASFRTYAPQQMRRGDGCMCRSCLYS
jgi:hypothetical protein